MSVTNTKRLKRDPLTSAGKPSRWTCSTTISTTDADDFLGRVVLPLDAVATAGATSDAEKRTEWYPWRDLARANPPRGEVLIRAYFPFEMEGVETDAERVESAESVLDPAVSRNAAALRRRFAAKETHDARRKATRLELEKHGLRRELEAQLRVQLEAHDWPVDPGHSVRPRLRQARAREPPDPAAAARTRRAGGVRARSETAERTRDVFARKRKNGARRRGGGGGINETRVSESAEEGSETRVFKKSAENAETPAPPNTDGPSRTLRAFLVARRRRRPCTSGGRRDGRRFVDRPGASPGHSGTRVAELRRARSETREVLRRHEGGTFEVVRRRRTRTAAAFNQNY